MFKVLKNQSGFGVVLELVVLAAFLVVAGAIFWGVRNAGIRHVQTVKPHNQQKVAAALKSTSDQSDSIGLPVVTQPPAPSTAPIAAQTTAVYSGIKGETIIGASAGCYSDSRSGSSCTTPPPIQAVVEVREPNGTPEGGKTLASTQSDANGNFRITIVPGSYVLYPRPFNRMNASPQAISVSSDRYQSVVVTYN